MITRVLNIYGELYKHLSMLEPAALLFLRLSVARLFLISGLGKWSGFLDFNEQKYDLFLYEFFCSDRKGALKFCNTETGEYDNISTEKWIESFAVLTGVLEVLLPVMIIVGIFTRVAAVGLLVMTLFIQFFVFTDVAVWWGSHMWWSVVLFAILVRGPGFLSADKALGIDPRPQN
jgi:putative oxidoreductase